MIRIAHFSDLHYGTKNLPEADRCFGAAIDRAITLGVEAAVLSGDATDHGLDLHAPAAERLLAQVRRLADHCPVLMLQGTFSHEPPGTLAIFRLLGGRHPVHVADRIEQVALTAQGEWLASMGWCFDRLPGNARALFSCVPTVNKAAVAAAVGATEAAQAVGEQLALLLRGYAPINRAARRQGVPTIGVSHGTVFGCVSEHGVPMAGFDHEFTTGALFGAEAQAFMLGHIHRHQAWEQESGARRQCIAYPGSIGRFHYGEEGDKGFLFWEVDADQARFTLEPTPACRTVDIVFEGKPDLDALRTAVAQQDIAGAFVRVRWTVADEDRQQAKHHRAALDRLKEALAALPAPYDEQRLIDARNAMEQAAQSVVAAEQSHLGAVRDAEALGALVHQATALAGRQAKVTNRIAKVEAELGNWNLFAKCMSNDGLIALAIDDAGPALAGLANDLLLACYGPRFTVSLHTLVETGKGEQKEGFDILVHDGESGESKSVGLMSGGERVWVNECLIRAVALYLAQHTGRRYGALFSDEADGPLDPERKRMFMAMKREVLRLGGYQREFFVSQTPELTAMADAVIDLDLHRAEGSLE